MDWKRICISVVVLAALVLGEYLLYSWEILTLSELGVIAGSALLSLAGIALGVLWRDDIVQWWKARRDLHHSSSIPSIYNKNGKPEQELALLVSPLYAKLNKNDEIVDFMTTYKISRLNTYDKSSIDELGQLETEIKEIMLQYLPLASDQLHNLINKFLELRPDWEQSNTFEAKETLWEIKKVVKERQYELRTKRKQP